MVEWLRANPTVGWWLFGLSVLTFLGSLIAVPSLVVRMPADHFLRDERAGDSWRAKHPAVRLLVVILKNVVGFILVVAGLIMSIPPIPGQGVLTMVIGLSMMNFPGKRALELRIVRMGPVLKAINWIRARRNRPPLQIPMNTDPGGE